MTARRSSEKKTAKKRPKGSTKPRKKAAAARKTKSSGAKPSRKKAAPARKKSSKAKKSAKPRASKAAVGGKAKARRAKPAGPRKSATARKSGATRRPTSKTSRRRSTAKPRRAPVLNLGRFENQLREKQAELLQAYLSAKGDTRTRESDGTEDYIDYAVSSYDREFLLSLTELEQSQLRLVEQALKRIQGGGFGLCTQCERPIPTKRLEVQPWAMYCVRCQELADTGSGDEMDFPSDDDDLDEDFEDDDEDGEEPDVEVEDHDRLIGG